MDVSLLPLSSLYPLAWEACKALKTARYSFLPAFSWSETVANVSTLDLFPKTAALAAGGQSRIIPDVYKQAVGPFGPAPTSKQPPIANWQDDLPRRRVVRKMRETLVKSTILVGVAHCIEASWVLSGALEEGDKVSTGWFVFWATSAYTYASQDDTFVREGYDADGKALERGNRGLGRIYQHNDASLMEKFGKAGIPDIGKSCFLA